MKYKLNIVLLFLLMALIAGLRYRMAPDSVWYMTWFESEVPSLDSMGFDDIFHARYEPLWNILASVCKSIGGYFFFQVTVSSLLAYFVIFFFKNATKMVFLGVSLYIAACYLYFSMEILRESLAISLFLMSVIFLSREKYFKMTMAMLCAIGFHKFAIFSILLLLLSTRRVSFRMKLLAAALVAVLLTITGDPINYAEPIILSFSSADLSFYKMDVNLTFAGYAYNILRFLPVLIFLYIYRNRDIPNLLMSRRILYSGCLVYVVLIFIRITATPYVDRVANYFVFFPLVLFACTVPDFIAKFLRLRTAAIFSPFVLILVVLFNTLPLLSPNPAIDIPTYKRYYPYYTFMSGDVDPDREEISRLEAKE
ncbi:EpsG family protein [Pandoraea pneumonica]|uniref:EpsG family protein n=1 Tax=Pandoraea pneumonica TaxID=2508299 RepID=UPI0015829C41|nr:EpsG family protein [Pandoraea pneumonica]